MTGPETNCIFCLVGSGRIPAHSVFGNERLLAFLDIHPIRPGHVQIIPRTHYPGFDELPPDLLVEIAALGQILARRLKTLFDAPRAGFLFTGADIAHAHAHVLPLHANDDITSRHYIVQKEIDYRLPPTPPNAEMQAIASRIREGLVVDP